MIKDQDSKQRTFQHGYKNYEILTDDMLLSYYKDTPSVKKTVQHLYDVLKKHDVDHGRARCIIRNMLPMVVPPGTKSKLKGDILNSIVKSELYKIYRGLDSNRFILCFEQKCHGLQEIPDWYLEDTINNRKLVGYNQMDLWTGGHQVNRAGKYILDETFHKRLARQNIRLVCVVCSRAPLIDMRRRRLSKVQQIVKTGINKSILFYPKNIKSAVQEFCSVK